MAKLKKKDIEGYSLPITMKIEETILETQNIYSPFSLFNHEYLLHQFTLHKNPIKKYNSIIQLIT